MVKPFTQEDTVILLREHSVDMFSHVDPLCTLPAKMKGARAKMGTKEKSPLPELNCSGFSLCINKAYSCCGSKQTYQDMQAGFEYSQDALALYRLRMGKDGALGTKHDKATVVITTTLRCH